jgi:hypothetical protein
MTKFRTFAAVALAATTLTTVAATDSAFAWGRGYGHGFYGHDFGRYHRDFRYFGSGYGYGYGYSYPSDCSYWGHRRWGCWGY